MFYIYYTYSASVPKCVYKSLGCWKDRLNYPRLITSLEGEDPLLVGLYKQRHNAIRMCYEVAVKRKFPGFALQDLGQCFSSDDILLVYQTLGKADGECSSGKGGDFANDVYKMCG